eukprot:652237_1
MQSILRIKVVSIHFNHNYYTDVQAFAQFEMSKLVTLGGIEGEWNTIPLDYTMISNDIILFENNSTIKFAHPGIYKININYMGNMAHEATDVMCALQGLTDLEFVGQSNQYNQGSTYSVIGISFFAVVEDVHQLYAVRTI